jgi:hypothetical protein
MAFIFTINANKHCYVHQLVSLKAFVITIINCFFFVFVFFFVYGTVSVIGLLFKLRSFDEYSTVTSCHVHRIRKVLYVSQVLLQGTVS